MSAATPPAKRPALERRRPFAPPKLACCVLIVLLSSCGEPPEVPYLQYRVEFEAEMAEAASGTISRLAKSRGWYVRREEGVPAEGSEEAALFSMAVFPEPKALREGKAILRVRAAQSHLLARFHDHDDTPLKELDGFALEVEAGLECVTGAEVCREDVRKGYCDEPRAPDLLFKARFVPPMADGAADALRAVAARWPGLRARDHTEVVKGMTSWPHAFEALLLRESPGGGWRKALKVGNGDNQHIAQLEAYQVGGQSAADMHRLAQEAIEALEARFGSPFCRVDFATGLCGAGAAPGNGAPAEGASAE